MTKLDSWKDLVDAWGGPGPFAESIGAERTTAYSICQRGSCNVMYWPRIIAKAPSKGIKGVTLELLVELQTSNRKEIDLRRKPFRRSTPSQIAAE